MEEVPVTPLPVLMGVLLVLLVAMTTTTRNHGNATTITTTATTTTKGLGYYLHDLGVIITTVITIKIEEVSKLVVSVRA